MFWDKEIDLKLESGNADKATPDRAQPVRFEICQISDNLRVSILVGES